MFTEQMLKKPVKAMTACPKKNWTLQTKFAIFRDSCGIQSSSKTGKKKKEKKKKKTDCMKEKMTCMKLTSVTFERKYVRKMHVLIGYQTLRQSLSKESQPRHANGFPRAIKQIEK